MKSRRNVQSENSDSMPMRLTATRKNPFAAACARLLELPEITGIIRGRAGIEYDFCAIKAEGPASLREVPVITDHDAYAGDGGLENGESEVPWSEEVLLPVVGKVRI